MSALQQPKRTLQQTPTPLSMSTQDYVAANIQQPAHWTYDIGPDGQSRASYPGIVADQGAPVANVLDYGADPTNVVDSSAAFAAALASGKAVYVPAGGYRINAGLTVNQTTLYGDGKTLTKLIIDQAFSPTAPAVLTLTGLEQAAPIVRDLAIQFVQPIDQGSRANFRTLAQGGTSGTGGTGVQYPPAILVNPNAANRIRLQNLLIQGAWDGIVNESIGGAWMDNIEVGALNRGLALDNGLDFCHIKGFHFWNFGFNSGPLYNVFDDGNTYAARIGANGQVNGLSGVDFQLFVGQMTIDNAGTWCSFANLALDGGAALTVNNCNWFQASNLYATGAAPAGVSGLVWFKNGQGTITNLQAVCSTPSVWVDGGELVITGGIIAPSTTGVMGIRQTAGTMSVSNVMFLPNTGAGTWTVPLVYCTGGTTSFIGNAFNVPNGTVGGTSNVGLNVYFMGAGQIVADNQFNGWLWAIPSGGGSGGFYGFNGGANSSPAALPSNNWTANGTTAVSLTAVAPAGAHPTVQEWLTIKDANGTARYIPCF